MPTRILLLRHAESADPSVFHGAESDVDLSPRGREQAERAALHLASFAPAAVVSSAMRRALATAGAIARACGREVLIEPALHERRVGAMSGLPTSDPDGPWPATVERWVAGETGYAIEGAESFDDIRARVLPVWERLAIHFFGQTIVIVCHGVVCKVLLASVLDGYTVADWQRLGPTHNVGVNELVRDGEGWWAERISDISYLRSL